MIVKSKPHLIFLELSSDQSFLKITTLTKRIYPFYTRNIYFLLIRYNLKLKLTQISSKLCQDRRIICYVSATRLIYYLY